MDQSGESPLAQQSASSEADTPYSSLNQEFLAPDTMGEKSSMAVGDKSPGHVTSESGNSHPVNLAGPTGHSSMQYQGSSYTILDELVPEQAFYLTQGDSLLELVAFLEALQLALSRRFGDFAFLRFDSVGCSHHYVRWRGSPGGSDSGQHGHRTQGGIPGL